MPDIMGGMDIAFPHLGIYLKYVPKTFTVFGFEIALYGVIIAIGMIVGFSLASHQAKYNGFNGDHVWDFAMYAIVLGILGARIYYVIFSWDSYKNNIVEIFNIRNGGLAIYGGLIAGFTTLFVFCYKKKINPLNFADACVPGIAMGQLAGRWGNFTNREAFGQYTDSLFAMRLPVSAVRAGDISASIAENMIDGTNFIQVHPTFLYESLWNLCLMAFLVWWTKRKRFSGQVMTFYFAGYGIGRLWIEGLRTDQLIIGHTGIAVSQVVCVAIIILAVVLNILLWNKGVAIEKLPEADKTEMNNSDDKEEDKEDSKIEK